MSEFIGKRSKKIGMPAGALVHIGEQKSEKAVITIINYDESHFEEKEIKTIEECLPFKDKPSVTWINIDGLHETHILEKLGEIFGLHPLVLEDIMNTDQRPKVEDFGSYLFIVLKSLHCEEKVDKILAEQTSIILGNNFIISFQEKKGNIFNPIKDRLRTCKGRIRKSGPDFLTHALLDAIVDNYFLILEKLEEKVEYLEEKVLTRPNTRSLKGIHKLKSNLIFLRKSVWPLREVISVLERGQSPLFKDATLIYLKDVYDHTIQIIDSVENFRDMTAVMHDIYLSSLSIRMNQVMKVLMIIATIFIPSTFMAGFYGMNFKYMPLLEWRWGFFIILAAMTIIALSMLMYFRKKKWL